MQDSQPGTAKRRLPKWMALSLLSAAICALPDVPLLSQRLGLNPLAAVAQTSPEARKEEADRLLELGIQQFRISQFREALASWQAALAIYREIGDRAGEGNALGNLGVAYDSLGQYQQAIDLYEQHLTITREIGDRAGEGAALGNLGVAYDSLGQYQQTIDLYQQALTIFREIGDRAGEGAALGNLGVAYDSLGQYQQAIDLYQQRLTIFREIGDRAGEGTALGNLGNAYLSLGQYQQAIDLYQQRLTIARKIGDRAGEGAALGNLGIAYLSLGQYQQAIDLYQQHLTTTREIGDRAGEGAALGNLGNVYNNLGQYQQAIDLYQQHLTTTREIGDRAGEGAALGNLGIAYNNLGQYQQAIAIYQQALTIFREIGDRAGEGAALGNLGIAYNNLGQYQQAIAIYQQVLTIFREIGDRAGEGAALGNLGIAYNNLGQYQQAIAIYQQGLAVFQEIGASSYEGLALANIGRTYDLQEESELAIVFLKASVNVRETIRTGIQELDTELQQSYTNTVTDDYRYLVNLLFEQDRIMEALVVSDLLKVQELQDFLRDISGAERTIQGIEMLAEEQQFLNGLQIDQLDEYAQSDEVNALMAQLRQTAPAQNLTLDVYDDLQARLQNLGTNSALFFPLILEDRIELILFTRNALPINRSVTVNSAELESAIRAFRADLENPFSQDNALPINRSVTVNSAELESAIRAFRADLENPFSQDIETSAQQLYEWLIAPIENDLQNANIETLIYASDGQMRYIPLAALYDGEQWLIENYQINYITALSLTDIEPRSLDNPQILAGAFSETNSTVTVGDEEFSFRAIPFAQDEVDKLTEIFPNTRTLLDDDFNRNAISADQINPYDIVHLATHGKLVSGTPENSFILLNNDEYITLSEIRDWQLPNAALVVLSACQTALGERLGSGIEVVGFGYQLQQAQARAAIASLWEISDSTTSDLMNTFYALLQSNEVAPIEALRQAQIALINNDYELVGDRVRGQMFGVGPRQADTPPENVADRLKHPYYWAPFILIGNGL